MSAIKPAADGNERQRSGSALGAICAWARGDMEEMGRRPLDAEQLALFLRVVNDLTWRAVDYVDERRPDLGHEGSQCGPDCWGCQRRIGGVHRSAGRLADLTVLIARRLAASDPRWTNEEIAQHMAANIMAMLCR